MKRIYFIFFLLFALGALSARSETPNQEAADSASSMISAGGANNLTPGGVVSGMNAASVSANVPYANSHPPESSYYGGAATPLARAGTTVQTNCASNPTGGGTTAFLQQSCNAINLMSTDSKTLPSVPISSTDPMLTAEQTALQSASHVVYGASGVQGSNPNGLGIAGSYSNCTTTTVPPPATTSTDTCYIYTMQSATDTLPTTDYQQCQQSVGTPRVCSKTLGAAITMKSVCTVSGSFTALVGAYDVVMGCVNSAMASVTVSITPAAQCHAYGCNSDYHSMTLNFMPGIYASNTQTLAVTYDGNPWENTTVIYDSSTNFITIESHYHSSALIANNPLPSSGVSKGDYTDSYTLFGTYHPGIYEPYTITDDSGRLIQTFVPSPSCPSGTDAGADIPGYTFGRYYPPVYTPYLVTDSYGRTINVCAVTTSCPTGSVNASYIVDSLFSIMQGPVYTAFTVTDQVGRSISVCAAGDSIYSGGISIQPFVTSSWTDNCAPFE